MRRIFGKNLRAGAIGWMMCILIAPFVFLGCGDSSSDDDVGQDFDSSNIPSDLTSVEEFIYSDVYAGHLVLHVDESIGARLNASSKSLYSINADDASLADVNALLSQYPQVEILKSVDADEDEVDAERERLEGLSGQQLTDWNSIYHIDVADPADAVAIMREIKNRRGVS
jgi:hypothetical protein